MSLVAVLLLLLGQSPSDTGTTDPGTSAGTVHTDSGGIPTKPPQPAPNGPY